MIETNEKIKQAAAAISLGLETTIPVTPILPLGCTPMGMVTENAYLVTSPKELRKLLRAVTKATKGQEIPTAVIRNIKIRLMSSGSFQISSDCVFGNSANVS